MDLALSDEQQSVAEHLAAYFQKECPSERVRAAEPLGFDDDLWRDVVAMGLPSMAVPVTFGGGGASLETLGIAAHELGRRVAPVPLLEASVAASLLARLAAAGSTTAADLLGEAVDGHIPTLAVVQPVGGVARAVPAGAVAEALLILRGDDVVALRDGQSRRLSPPNLGSSPIADWDLDSAGTVVLASGADAVAAYERATDEWRALQAMAQIGIAQTALGLGVDYVKQRRAFGVLVGWFQAVQHRLADVVTRIEGAELLGFEALWALDERRPDAAALASMAFLFSAETAFSACSESLQFHGGYGFTLEYDIQLYLRRAKAWPLALGDPQREYRRLASLLLGVGE